MLLISILHYHGCKHHDVAVEQKDRPVAFDKFSITATCLNFLNVEKENEITFILWTSVRITPLPVRACIERIGSLNAILYIQFSLQE